MLLNKNERLLDAIAFVARKHQGQFRRDGKTPYVSHVLRVAITLPLVFNVCDPEILTAAVLHDTLEDTTADFDDLEKRYGRKIAHWVSLLSKDSRLPEAERESAYKRQLASAPAEVKLIKLADMHDNLLDTRDAKPKQALKTRGRMREYLKALSKGVARQPALKAPFRIVKALAS